MSDVNERQVGGDHYKKLKIQPWDYVGENGLGYFEGTAIEYLTRFRDKNGIEDLKKAIHYIEKLISNIEKEAPSQAADDNAGECSASCDAGPPPVIPFADWLFSKKQDNDKALANNPTPVDYRNRDDINSALVMLQYYDHYVQYHPRT